MSISISDFIDRHFRHFNAAALRDELRRGRGFVVVKGLPIERYSEQEACAIYWRAAAIGTPRTLDEEQRMAVLSAAAERAYGSTRRIER